MRIFAISDIHVDFEVNRRWLYNLSRSDYRQDILILAGDVSDDIKEVISALSFLSECFKKVFFVTGNHDLWVWKDKEINSFDKLKHILKEAQGLGVETTPFLSEQLSIIPLFGWYDFSFGEPKQEIIDLWADFYRCKWPENYSQSEITNQMLSGNLTSLPIRSKFTISFSHFVPRIDLLPYFIPDDKKKIFPLLGSVLLENQIRELQPDIHVYGHSHVNIDSIRGNIRYINNAYGYPYEKRITAKKMLCIYQAG